MKTEVAFLEAWRRKEKFYKKRRTLDRISEMWTVEEWILPPHVFDLCNCLSVGTDHLNNTPWKSYNFGSSKFQPWLSFMDLSWSAIEGLRARDLKAACLPYVKPALRTTTTTPWNDPSTGSYLTPQPRLGRVRISKRVDGVSGITRTCVVRYNNCCWLLTSLLTLDNRPSETLWRELRCRKTAATSSVLRLYSLFGIW